MNALPVAFGKYELVARIGCGGMAEIFRAKLPGAAGFEKTVVIKRLHPHHARDQRVVDMFVNEAKLAAQMHHRNIVQVFELDRLPDGELFIAMEHVPGTDLKQLLRLAGQTGTRVPPWFSVHVMIEVLDALSFVHALRDEFGKKRTIIHRDVSPANILISSLGDVKLADFGVAKDGAREGLTAVGQIKGKVSYVSPEQLRGEKIDVRADVFSAGVTLWECLTQQRLFGGKPLAEVLRAVQRGTREPPSKYMDDIPPALDECVLRAIAADADERTGSAREMQKELRAILIALRPHTHSSDVREVVEALVRASEQDAPQASDTEVTPDNKEPNAEEVALIEAIMQRLDVVLVEAPDSAPDASEAATELAVSTSPLTAQIEKYKRDRAAREEPPPPNALWIKNSFDNVRGPFTIDQLIDQLKEATFVSAAPPAWISISEFARLMGQEALVDPFGDREKVLPQEQLSGSLEETSVTALFGRLTREQATGILILTNPELGARSRREVVISEGKPLFVYAAARELQLPELLVTKGIISRELLAELIHQAVAEQRPLGDLVSERTGTKLSTHWPSLMRERLLDVFRWTTGRFAFTPGPAGDGVPFSASLMNLLPDLVYRAKTPDVLRESLEPMMKHRFDRSPDFPQGIAALGLTELQMLAVKPFGGGRKLATSLASGRRDERINLTIAHLLVETQLIVSRD